MGLILGPELLGRYKQEVVANSHLSGRMVVNKWEEKFERWAGMSESREKSAGLEHN
jgi:hypothetical protein